jgi:glutathione S-transferase
VLKPGKRYVLGRFTYADVVMATLLQGVLPVTDAFLGIPSATREVWTEEGLVRDYADLLTWRDELYERHRAARVS